MQQLGYTRSARAAAHLLQTPDAFVRAPLAGMRKATAIVHAAAAIGAKFTEYTAEFEAGGALGPAAGQRFVYVLEGAISIAGRTLSAGQYAYLPADCEQEIAAETAARAAVIEKPYLPLDGMNPPALLIGDERTLTAEPLGGDEGLMVRMLLPDKPEFDFAVNILTFAPGAALPMVEMHVMEHGLLMLEGGGVYRLGDCWYPVAAGDFIWMAPYCPQWFGAIGKMAARYLIYKDWNRV